MVKLEVGKSGNISGTSPPAATSVYDSIPTTFEQGHVIAQPFAITVSNIIHHLASIGWYPLFQAVWKIACPAL
jgi:hypothetical protein